MKLIVFSITVLLSAGILFPQARTEHLFLTAEGYGELRVAFSSPARIPLKELEAAYRSLQIAPVTLSYFSETESSNAVNYHFTLAFRALSNVSCTDAHLLLGEPRAYTVEKDSSGTVFTMIPYTNSMQLFAITVNLPEVINPEYSAAGAIDVNCVTWNVSGDTATNRYYVRCYPVPVAKRNYKSFIGEKKIQLSSAVGALTPVDFVMFAKTKKRHERIFDSNSYAIRSVVMRRKDYTSNTAVCELEVVTDSKAGKTEYRHFTEILPLE